MKYDFIEIGTSDFRTLANSVFKNGISIEPVTEYFERLPTKDGLIKINSAISDKNGTSTMYYYPREVIEKFELASWFAGCHSLGKPHQPCVEYLRLKQFSDEVIHNDIIKTQEIAMITLEDVFSQFEVEEVDFLKIDTEGHDAVIMKSFFALEDRPKVNKIQFESNILMDRGEWAEICELSEANGYSFKTETTRGNEDTILTLR